MTKETYKKIRTEDGFVVGNTRHVCVPFGKEVPVSELIGAVITSIESEQQQFRATIAEKTYCVECNDNDGIAITSVEFPFVAGDSVEPVEFPEQKYRNHDEDDE